MLHTFEWEKEKMQRLLKSTYFAPSPPPPQKKRERERKSPFQISFSMEQICLLINKCFGHSQDMCVA